MLLLLGLTCCLHFFCMRDYVIWKSLVPRFFRFRGSGSAFIFSHAVEISQQFDITVLLALAFLFFLDFFGSGDSSHSSSFTCSSGEVATSSFDCPGISWEIEGSLDFEDESLHSLKSVDSLLESDYCFRGITGFLFIFSVESF